MPFAISHHVFAARGPPFEVPMIENIESKESAGLGYPGYFAQSGVEIRDVFQRAVVEYEIKIMIFVGQPLAGITPVHGSVLSQQARPRDGPFVKIAPSRKRLTGPGNCRKFSVSAAMVERLAFKAQRACVLYFGNAAKRDAGSRRIIAPERLPKSAVRNST